MKGRRILLTMRLGGHLAFFACGLVSPGLFEAAVDAFGKRLNGLYRPGTASGVFIMGHNAPTYSIKMYRLT